jgi:hypothetical protein
MNKNQMAIVRLENLSVNLQKALGNVERISQMDPASLDKTFLGRLQELHQEVGMLLANLAQEDDDAKTGLDIKRTDPYIKRAGVDY